MLFWWCRHERNITVYVKSVFIWHLTLESVCFFFWFLRKSQRPEIYSIFLNYLHNWPEHGSQLHQTTSSVKSARPGIRAPSDWLIVLKEVSNSFKAQLKDWKSRPHISKLWALHKCVSWDCNTGALFYWDRCLNQFFCLAYLLSDAVNRSSDAKLNCLFTVANADPK